MQLHPHGSVRNGGASISCTFAVERFLSFAKKAEHGRAMLGQLRAQAQLVTQDHAVSKTELGGKRKSFWNALTLPGNNLFASAPFSNPATLNNQH